MRPRRGPELTDDDLRRLARLGGGAENIAEAAGLDAVDVERRLDRTSRRAPGAGVTDVLVRVPSDPAGEAVVAPAG